MAYTLKECMLPAPKNGGFRMDGYWIWCGSVVKGEDGRYHMFASRWSKEISMHPGWLLKSEVVRAVADTPIGPFRFEEVVLPARGAEYWDGIATHNPHIVKIGDIYVLYYMGTTHPFPGQWDVNDKVLVARANKRIGIATSNSVFGPWKRQDAPILSTRPGFFDNFLVSNPAPSVMGDGSVYLVYKARSYVSEQDRTWGNMMLGIARADSYDGKYVPLTSHPIFPPEYEVEDPFIWHKDGEFHLIAKDMKGHICGQRFGGIHAVSQDGVQWNVDKDVLYYDREILWDDGIVRKMGNLERPFILYENGRPTHVYFATSDGNENSGFVGCENTWNMVVPLKNCFCI